jgi:hypothetical protein
LTQVGTSNDDSNEKQTHFKSDSDEEINEMFGLDFIKMVMASGPQMLPSASSRPPSPKQPLMTENQKSKSVESTNSYKYPFIRYTQTKDTLSIRLMLKNCKQTDFKYSSLFLSFRYG